jgi:uncharacterized OB-fold protein
MSEAEKKQIPIHEGLFTWPSDDPRLIASKCKNCGQIIFPAQESCPNCCLEDVEQILLSKRGTLWTWTVQGFYPKSPPYAGPDTPETFVPFGVGYIELSNEVRIESRLTENNPEKLKVGMDMELVIEKFKEDEEGNDVMIFAFKPVTG